MVIAWRPRVAAPLPDAFVHHRLLYRWTRLHPGVVRSTVAWQRGLAAICPELDVEQCGVRDGEVADHVLRRGSGRCVQHRTDDQRDRDEKHRSQNDGHLLSPSQIYFDASESIWLVCLVNRSRAAANEHVRGGSGLRDRAGLGQSLPMMNKNSAVTADE